MTLLLLLCFITIAGCDGGNYAPVQMGKASVPMAKHYRVRRGDTLYSIAWAYGLDYRQLRKINELKANQAIYPGQILRVSPKFHPNVSKRSSASVIPSRKRVKHAKESLSSRRLKHLTPRSKKIFYHHGPIRRWHWPAHGKIIGYFAPAKGNKGINIAGSKGSPIYAAAKGVVVYTGSGLAAYGRMIIIKNSADYLSAYAHNQTILVKEGQRVRGGQRIATMGRTGSQTTLLHFEIRYRGSPVNPLHYLPRH